MNEVILDKIAHYIHVHSVLWYHVLLGSIAENVFIDISLPFTVAIRMINVIGIIKSE
jgi:hypothetical protein